MKPRLKGRAPPFAELKARRDAKSCDAEAALTRLASPAGRIECVHVRDAEAAIFVAIAEVH